MNYNNYTNYLNIHNKYFGPKLNGINLQEAGNLFMENIIYFHNFLLCILLIIVVLVSWFLIRTLIFFGNPKLGFELYLISQAVYAVLLRYLDVILYYLYIISSWLEKFLTYIELVYYFYKNKNNVEKQYSKKDKPKKFPAFPTINWDFDAYQKKLIKEQNYYFVFFLNYIKLGKYATYSSFIRLNNLEYRYYFYSDVLVEFLWTLFPAIILAILAIPSFSLLFSIQKYAVPEITVKVIGHQWYWEYQFMDYIKVNKKINYNIDSKDIVLLVKNKKDSNYIIESYMVQDDDLNKGQLRLLEVDNKLVLPINTSIRLLITSDDVLHSWAVPSLGIKLDACPGRINELVINIREVGAFYGQCSELCGWYHGFMPIAIQSLNKDDFKYYAMCTFMDFFIQTKNKNITN